MGFLSAVVGIVDAAGNRVDPLRSDGSRAPIVVKLGAGMSVGEVTENGGTTTVELVSTATPGEIDDVAHGARGWLVPASIDLMHPEATPSTPGFESAADKTKVDSVDSGAQVVRIVDYAFDNPIFTDYTRTGNTLESDVFESLGPPIGTRVLAFAEVDPDKDGWWTIVDAGSLGSPTILERTTGATEASMIRSGCLTLSLETSKLYAMTAEIWPGAKVLNTDALAFEEVTTTFPAATIVAIAVGDSPFAASGRTIIRADLNGGAITVTLPDPSELTTLDKILVKVEGVTGGNTLTVDGDGASIDGAGTRTLTTDFEALELTPDGANWIRTGHATF